MGGPGRVRAAASWALAGVLGPPFTVDVTASAVAFVFSAAIGVFFGYVPARRAALFDQIEALRHEQPTLRLHEDVQRIAKRRSGAASRPYHPRWRSLCHGASTPLSSPS